VSGTGPRVALVGCGNWGRHILRDLVSLGCAVTVVARSEESVRRAEHGGAQLVVSCVEKLGEIDGIVVAVPTLAHPQVVESLLPRNLPLFVEKPLAVEVRAAERIAGAAPDRVFVMDKWRYHPGVEALADIAASGELGLLRAVETTRVGWGNPHGDADGIWHLVPHDLSIIRHIVGALPPPQAARADVVDGVSAGLVGMLGDEPWARLEVHTRSTQRIRRTVIRCDDGIACLPDAYADHIEVLSGYPERDRAPEPERRPISAELPLLRELRAFVRHLAGGPPPLSSAEEGADTCRMIAALRRLAGLDS
jgi:predicted dehydrogenase